MASFSLNPLDNREIWFTNMLLLEFDPASSEEKFKVPFSRDMFAHICKKGMEVVMHFLFTCLNAKLAQEEFRDCWPVYDKKQEQQFRKMCCNWLASIAKEHPDSKLPRLAASLLLSPGGDKFYHFLLRFSAYVLHTVCLREAKSEEKQVFVSSFIGSPSSVLHSAQKDVTSAALKGHMVRHVEHVTRRMGQVAALHLQWESYASELASEYRAHCKEGKDLAKKLSSLQAEQKQLALNRHGTPTRSLCVSSASEEKVLSLTAEVEAAKRQTRMKKARGYWRSIEDFISKSSHQREIVESILQGEANKYSFDSKDIVLQIPEIVRKEYEQLTREGRAGNTFEAGKLNLISLVKVWNCALRVLRAQLEENVVPSFEAETQHVSQELHVHRANLAAAQKLRASLCEFQTSVSASVQRLEERLVELRRSRELSAVSLEGVGGGGGGGEGGPVLLTVPTTITLPTLGLDLLPPSPVKSVVATPESKWKQRVTFTADATSTPEAVQDISRSIHLATQRKHTKPSQIPTAPSGVSKPSVSATSLPTPKHADLSIFEDSLTLETTASTSTQPQLRVKTPSKFEQSNDTSEKVPKTATKTRKKNRTTKPVTRVVKAPRTRGVDTGGSEKLENNQTTSGNDGRKEYTSSSVQTPLLQGLPQAHDLLADEIASAVAAADLEGASPNTPDTDIHSLVDPISAMGNDAFVSKDKLARTPLSRQPVSRLQVMQSTLSPVPQSPVIGSPVIHSTLKPERSLHTPPSGSPHYQPAAEEEALQREEVAAQESCFQEHSLSPEQPASAEQASSPEVSMSGSASPESLQVSSGVAASMLDSSSARGFGSPMVIRGSPSLDVQGSQTLPLLGSALQTPSSFGQISESSLLSSHGHEYESYTLPTADLLRFAPVTTTQLGSFSQPATTTPHGKSTRRIIFDPNSATPSKPLRGGMMNVSPAFSKAIPLLQSQTTPQVAVPLPPSSITSVTQHSAGRVQTLLEPSPLAPPPPPPPLSTPTLFPGLFASIEPPTPFRHADFDLDSSGEDQMLSELDNGTPSPPPPPPPPLLLLSNTQKPLTAPNLTESPIFVLNQQSQIDEGLLDLCDFSSSESSFVQQFAVAASPQELLIDLETS